MLPPSCARCGAPTAWPVEQCRECTGRRLAFASAVAGVAYVGAARPYLRAWKERGLRQLARPAAELIGDLVARPDAAVITPIAPNPLRQLKRSLHPAAGLARELGTLWGIDARPLLMRSRLTPRQAGTPRAERRANVQGAFAPLGPVPPRVVLVDDIYTSGATASAAAAALRRAGARHVQVVTFARAVR